MKRRFAVSTLAVALFASAVVIAAPASASPGAQAAKKAKKQPKNKVFLACRHGCKFRTIQRAVDAAGSFKHKRKNRKVHAIVKVKPGKYVEGVVLDGTLRRSGGTRYRFEGRLRSATDGGNVATTSGDLDADGARSLRGTLTHSYAPGRVGPLSQLLELRR